MLFRGFLILFGFYSSLVMADAYRCVEKGKVTISNSPCFSTKVVQSDNPPSESVYQAQSDLDRQRGYLVGREGEKRQDAIAARRSAMEVDAMYPDRKEVEKPMQDIPRRWCGNGGSCSTSRTISR